MHPFHVSVFNALASPLSSTYILERLSYYCHCHFFSCHTVEHVDVICKLSSSILPVNVFSEWPCICLTQSHILHSWSLVGWSAIFHTGSAHLFDSLVMMHLWSGPSVFPLPAGGFLYCTFLYLYSLSSKDKQSIQNMSWNGRCNSQHSVSSPWSGCVSPCIQSPSFDLIISWSFWVCILSLRNTTNYLALFWLHKPEDSLRMNFRIDCALKPSYFPSCMKGMERLGWCTTTGFDTAILVAVLSKH